MPYLTYLLGCSIEIPSPIGVLGHFLSGAHVGLCDELEVMFGPGALRCQNLTLVHIDPIVLDGLLYLSEYLIQLPVLDALIVEQAKLLNFICLEAFIGHEIVDIVWGQREQQPAVFVFGSSHL